MPRLPPQGWFTLLVLLFAPALPGCSPRRDGGVSWRQERYVLIAPDATRRLALAFDLTTDGQPSIDHDVLVGAAIIAIGADDRFIVVEQHPPREKAASEFDRSVTNYFVVKRTTSSSRIDREQGIFGPMREPEFDALVKERHLPPFTQRFTDAP